MHEQFPRRSNDKEYEGIPSYELDQRAVELDYAYIGLLVEGIDDSDAYLVKRGILE